MCRSGLGGRPDLAGPDDNDGEIIVLRLLTDISVASSIRASWEELNERDGRLCFPLLRGQEMVKNARKAFDHPIPTARKTKQHRTHFW